METITVKAEGTTLDLLLWRRYGVRGQGLLEETYALNPGLAARGPELPLGTVVTLPALPVAAATAAPVVTLFG